MFKCMDQLKFAELKLSKIGKSKEIQATAHTNEVEVGDNKNINEEEESWKSLTWGGTVDLIHWEYFEDIE